MARSDLTGDGSSDILWRNGATGEFGWWDMDHGNATWKDAGMVPLDWRLAGTGDYDRDGIADILWNREGPEEQISAIPPNTRSTDHLAWWDMGGGAAGTYRDLGDYTDHVNALFGRTFFTFYADPPAQDGLDFNGDGRGDVLLVTGRNGSDWTGVEIWLLDAAGQPTRTTPTSWGWNWAAAGDVTGDGTADMLWRQGYYGVGLWSFQGGAPVAWTDLGSTDISPGYAVIGTADVTGDGGQDVIWWNPLIRDIGVWDIDVHDGTPAARWIDLGILGGAWAFADAGDYDGDGTEDLLFRDATTGEVGYWSMKAGAIAAWHSLGTPPAEWQLAG